MVFASLAFASLVHLSPIVDAGSKPPQQPATGLESSSWYAEVSKSLAREEYVYQPLTNEPGVWSAPNRSQEVRGRISRAGLEVFPRATNADGIGAPWKLALSTKSFGRLSDVLDLDLPSIAVNGNRAELDHGVVREWFENTDKGIEQGWAISARPRGVEPLWIGIELGGDLDLRIDDRARSGALVDASGAVKLRYRDLLVFDATGRELRAQLRSSPAGVGIQIEDAGAVYPLTVDPVLTGPAWTTEGDQAGAQFGRSVSTAGDVNGDGYSDVVVGAPHFDSGGMNAGRAYVFLGSATGLSTSAAWTADGNQADAYFGFSVATAGDVNGDGFSDVIVGAYNFSNGQASEGGAFVYLGSAAGLSVTPSSTLEGDQALAAFGYSVATAGDVNGDSYSDVIVGATGFDNGQSNGGRAFVYMGSAAGLSPSPAWTADSNQPNAGFGNSVATAGDVNGDGYSDVIVGASGFDGGQPNEGRAYVYLGSGAGLSTSPAWTADGGQQSAVFGCSVATAGDVNGDGYSDVIVGAYGFDNGQTDEGRAVVYMGSSTGLSTSAAWTAECGQTNGLFGFSVSTAGDLNGDGYSDVIVGALSFDNGELDEGRAYVYLGSASGLATSAAWTAEGGQMGALFGVSVSTAGDVNGDGYSDVIVGAYGFDNDQGNEGRAFVYMGSPTGLATDNAWAESSYQAQANYGISVATAGDVNGDGYSDVIVGANLFDNGQTDEGRAYLYLGSASGLATSAAWTVESDQANAHLGRSVATAGDVNGDGFSDVIVGAHSYDNGQTDEGRVDVYLGSASGLAASPAWTAEGNQSDASFGVSVATAGDVNGDGYSDVIVGANGFSNGQSFEGRAFVYLGSGGGLAASPAWTAESDQTNSGYARWVATAGDVNGDGFSDVIVGAYAFDNGETDEGRAYVYLGSATGLAPSAAWTTESNQAGAAFGFAVATAGDVNGDGYSDVIIGAHSFDNGQTNEGRAYVYLGSAAGLAASPAWTAESDLAGAAFGYSVATAGDVNGDGFSDVIVGANGFGIGGRAYEYSGSATGLGTSPSWDATSDQPGANFGISVSSAGDVNGDGFGDVIVGASNFHSEAPDSGRADVFLGNEGRGSWTRAHQQRRHTGVASIAALGRSSSSTGFRIKLSLAHGLAGFAWAAPVAPAARLEWEIAPLGVPLDGRAIESSALDQGITALPLVFNELVEFVVPTSSRLQHIPIGPFHWRARLRTNNPLLPVTRWVSIQDNNVTESKLRAPPIGVLHAQ